MEDILDEIADTAEKRTVIKSIRMTPSEERELERRAEERGMRINAFIVWAITKAALRPDDAQDRQLVLGDGEGVVAVVERPAGADVADLPTWPCGHPKTQENSQKGGGGRVRCRTCRNAIVRASYARVKGKGGKGAEKDVGAPERGSGAK